MLVSFLKFLSSHSMTLFVSFNNVFRSQKPDRRNKQPNISFMIKIFNIFTTNTAGTDDAFSK